MKENNDIFKFYVRQVTDHNQINLDKCVLWMYEWWGKIEGWSKEKVYTYMKSSFNDDKLPKTIVAFNDKDEEIGMCQITFRDLDTRPDIYPYIANVYVVEKYRNKGVCKSILATAVKVAKESNLDKLYLYTMHEGLYEKYGWEFVEMVETHLNPHIQKLYKLDLNK